LEKARTLPEGMPSGMNPELDARQNVFIMFKGVDQGSFWNVFQVSNP